MEVKERWYRWKKGEWRGGVWRSGWREGEQWERDKGKNCWEGVVVNVEKRISITYLNVHVAWLARVYGWLCVHGWVYG